MNAEIGTAHDPDQWRAAGGNIQSTTFYLKLCHSLVEIEPFLTWCTWTQQGDDETFICAHRIGIADYGCAHGDGTAVLKATFPFAQVTGIDISEAAIAEAQARWPTLDFRTGDIRCPTDPTDAIIASHVIEHMSDPVSVIAKLRKFCHVLVVVVPTITTDKDGGHTGAVLTLDLVQELHGILKRYSVLGYLTVREDAKDGTAVIESNNVLVIEGEL